MTLIRPYAGNHPVSQAFDSHYAGEPKGWLVNDKHGPRFARRMITAKAVVYAHLHEAQDVSMPIGTDILAPQAGKLVLAGTRQDGAHYLYLLIHRATATEKYSTYFFATHLQKMSLPVGTKVTQGTHIAESGDTGKVTGPHLHWEIQRLAKTIDPHSSKAYSQAYRYDPVRCLTGGDLARAAWLVPNV